MKIIVDAPPEHLADAWKIADQETKRYDQYDRIGWGWGFNGGGARFFVKRLKDGLSIRYLKPKE